MRHQVPALRRALRDKVLDAWDVWDFTRAPEDSLWLEREFGGHVGWLTAPRVDEMLPIPVADAHRFTVAAEAWESAVIILRLSGNQSVELELGADQNGHTMCRVDGPDGSHQAKLMERLDPGPRNVLDVRIVDRSIHVSLRGIPLVVLTSDDGLPSIEAVHVVSRGDSPCLWSIPRDVSPGVRLIRCNVKSYAGFRQAYLHYAHSFYEKTCFVKIDDDVVWIDVERFPQFIELAENINPLTILSASVINNGVCAHYQQRDGLLAGLALDFEYPPGGAFGRLWESGARCSSLHDYFLSNVQSMRQRALRLADVRPLPVLDRFSINFIAFRHPIVVMQASLLSRGETDDDEEAMTVVLPREFGVQKAIHSHFLVSHFSFYAQDPHMDRLALLARYAAMSQEAD